MAETSINLDKWNFQSDYWSWQTFWRLSQLLRMALQYLDGVTVEYNRHFHRIAYLESIPTQTWFISFVPPLDDLADLTP